MSRSLPSPPMSSLPLSQLQQLANAQEDGQDRSPRDWFERARYESERAVLAERKGNKEEMFVAYTRACQCYTLCKMHPRYKDERAVDGSWAQRVKDFRETYETFLEKAKILKEQLKQREVEGHQGKNGQLSAAPPPSRQPSGPETGSMGSIADRMKALSGRGMDVGDSNKRFSRDMSSSSTVTSSMPGRSQASNHGAPTRVQQPAFGGRDRAGSSSSQHKPPPPLVAPKPQAYARPPSPALSQGSSAGTVKPTATGSSTRSLRTTRPSPTQPSTPVAPPPPTISDVDGAPITSPFSRPSLPPIPQSPAQPTRDHPPLPGFEILNPSPPPPPEPISSPPRPAADGLHDFEKAFPSLSEFGKQFEQDESPVQPSKANGYPFQQRPNGTHGLPPRDDDEPALSLPDVPSGFPSLPSAPTGRPGTSTLPPPPPRPEVLKPSPPSPSPDIPRPASTTNITSLPPDLLTSSPPEGIPPSLRPSEPPTHRSSLPKPPNGDMHPHPSLSLSFPQPKPTSSPQQSSTGPSTHGHGPPPSKPRFPFTNAVEPETLREYFLNDSVEMLLLDVRGEEEYKKGYVGKEYESRGAKVRVVWIDPTVLLRDGINSSKLEDALSLLPEAQRVAFERRHKSDLVVVYDARSASWPGQGAPPSPLSRLWDMIYEHEFTKRLERTPVLLTGGYEAWSRFIEDRARRHTRKVLGQVNGNTGPPGRPLSGDMASKRANREMPVYQSAQYAKNITDSFAHAPYPQSMSGEKTYNHQSPRPTYVSSPPPLSRSSQPPHPSHHHPSQSLSSAYSPIPPPPQAHPGPGARRRSDYLEHHSQPYSGSFSPSHTAGGRSIDYPQAHPMVQPPPAVQGNALERYDTRPAVVRSGSIRGLDLVAREGEEVRYWNDVVLGLTGLKNLGNTCYMNSTIQCLSATYPFTSYFLDGSYKKSINLINPLGMKGNLARAFAELLKALWKEDYTFLSPVTFRKNIISFASQFSGTEQHDSQEFLSFVLDGLHEDLNRVKHKPPPIEMTPEREAALESLPTEVASEKEWQIYRQRNDSFIVDLFQGQYRNRLECLTCHKTSTTFDTFMYMSLPVPTGKSKIVIQELIDEFIASEIMDGDDKWHCPRCKVPRRASKTLTIARLPPVLLIQLKRFSTQDGMFWNKAETHVIYPVNALDLTRYVPHRPRTGKEDLDDPRTQVGPFKYDLYGVSNHMGTLSSGHYTAYVKSSKGWMYCEDSKVSKAKEVEVVSRPAYILFYKRIKTFPA